MNFKMIEGETIIKEAKANRYANILLSQGGKLYLTNKRIVFVGHGLNIGEGTIAVNLDDILTVRLASSSMLALLFIPIPNAISIRTSNGTTHKFMVTKRNEWVDAISEQINQK